MENAIWGQAIPFKVWTFQKGRHLLLVPVLQKVTNSHHLPVNIACLSTTTISNIIKWTFYYPYPDYDNNIFITTSSPYLGHIGSLWTLAKTMESSLTNHIGNEWPKFYIVCSSFLYNTGGFSHIFSSCLTCLSFQPTPCSFAAEIGFGSTIMITGEGPENPIWSKMSFLVCRLITRCISLLSPTSMHSSLYTSSLSALHVL